MAKLGKNAATTKVAAASTAATAKRKNAKSNRKEESKSDRLGDDHEEIVAAYDVATTALSDDAKGGSTTVTAKSKKDKEEDETTALEAKPKEKKAKKAAAVVATESIPEPNSFASLVKPRRLSDGVLSYVQAQGFTRMTPVQAATIPHFLSHKDVVVQSVTGSGKTLAFLIPVLELLQLKTLKRPQIGALILSPTRELALQTYTVAKGLCASCQQPEPLLLVGGGSSSSSNTNSRPVTADLTAFAEKGSDLVIGTPGRVDDILSRYTAIACSELVCLVLDEADVLLNMGFATTLQTILSRLPKMRRTALFSATQSSSTTSSLTEWMHRVGVRNPVWIDVTIVSDTTTAVNGDANTAAAAGAATSKVAGKSQATPTSLTNYYIVTGLDEKLSRLVAFLRQHRHEKIIAFFLTCSCVDFFGTALQTLFPHSDKDKSSSGSKKNNHNISIEMLHGKMVQKRREKTMERFRESSDGAVLFCTDVAARGLDVSDVDWVVQFDSPSDPAMFIHRAGRTARAGKTGHSLVFLTPKEEAYIDFLQRRQVPLLPLPQTEECCPPPDDNDEEQPHAAATLDSDGRRRIRSSADPSQILDDVLPMVRDLALKDRDILEKGTQAFTSFIRAYKEHHCAFIFRFASLDLGMLATSFCLLRLPKMPELKDLLQKHQGRLPHFTPAGHDVDIFAIPYSNKVREQARQKRLAEELASGGGKNAKRIQAEQRKAEKEQRERDRRAKAVEKGRNPDKKRGRNAQLVDEWEDLAKEERLVKKLRRGKITKEEFNAQMSEG